MKNNRSNLFTKLAIASLSLINISNATSNIGGMLTVNLCAIFGPKKEDVKIAASEYEEDIGIKEIKVTEFLRRFGGDLFLYWDFASLSDSVRIGIITNLAISASKQEYKAKSDEDGYYYYNYYDYSGRDTNKDKEYIASVTNPFDLGLGISLSMYMLRLMAMFTIGSKTITTNHNEETYGYEIPNGSKSFASYGMKAGIFGNIKKHGSMIAFTPGITMHLSTIKEEVKIDDNGMHATVKHKGSRWTLRTAAHLGVGIGQ